MFLYSKRHVNHLLGSQGRGCVLIIPFIANRHERAARDRDAAEQEAAADAGHAARQDDPQNRRYKNPGGTWVDQPPPCLLIV